MVDLLSPTLVDLVGKDHRLLVRVASSRTDDLHPPAENERLHIYWHIVGGGW